MFPGLHIVAVLGGPGSGKGTQCSLLQARFRCAHYSVGDLLRAESAQPNSPYRDIITENMRSGRVGPKEITVGILKTNVAAAYDRGVRVVLLDGEPARHCNSQSVDNQC